MYGRLSPLARLIALFLGLSIGCNTYELQAASIKQWVETVFDTALGYVDFPIRSGSNETTQDNQQLRSNPSTLTSLSNAPTNGPAPEIVISEPQQSTIIPFLGYLPEIGPPSLRFTAVAPPINRHSLIPIPLPVANADEANKDNQTNEDPQEILFNMISSLIAEEFTAPTTEEAEATSVAEVDTSEAPTPQPLPSSEPSIPAGSDTTADDANYTDFLNPDEIILYFEEQTQNEGTTNSIGLPLRVPSKNTPDASPYPARATYQQSPESEN